MQHVRQLQRESRNRRGMAGAAVVLAVLLAVLLGFAGCSGKSSTPAPTATSSPTVAPTPAPAPTLASSANAGPDLSVYVGHSPLDKVGDHAFFDDPAVVSGVAAAVGDPAVAAAIAAMKGPVGPVKRIGGAIAASRCELHNCGAHNYAVHVDAASNQVSAVCYYDEKAGPIATWYKGDGTRTSEGGGCSVG